MKNWIAGFLLAMFVLYGMSQNAIGQDCSTGQCFRSPSDRPVVAVAQAVVAVPVRVVEHVVCGTQELRSVFCANGLAQYKAERQAASDCLRHVGGGLNGGCAEGVGFSTASPDAAIRACCYWGRRPVREIGVARGRRGWYATVIYE
jgi:hypothetical protein